MIPEPQKTYLLELLAALGPAADEFVLVGGQALKFVLGKARATKDFDFLLRRFREVPRVCFPEVTHLWCNEACN